MDDGPILICYDGSHGAKQAIATAAHLLSERRAIVLDVAPIETVVEAIETAAGGPVSSGDPNREAASGRANAGARMAREAGFNAVARVEFAAPTWQGVVGVADEIGAAAIVIAATGLSGLSELAKGKVPRAIAEHAGRPVLLVPPPKPTA